MLKIFLDFLLVPQDAKKRIARMKGMTLLNTNAKLLIAPQHIAGKAQ